MIYIYMYTIYICVCVFCSKFFKSQYYGKFKTLLFKTDERFGDTLTGHVHGQSSSHIISRNTRVFVTRTSSTHPRHKALDLG